VGTGYQLFLQLLRLKVKPFVVQGTGKSVVSPDIAKVDLGIQETGTNLKTVQDDVDKKSQTLVDQIKKLGIDSKDIKTISYSVYPQYDYTNSNSKNNRLPSLNPNMK